MQALVRSVAGETRCPATLDIKHAFRVGWLGVGTNSQLMSFPFDWMGWTAHTLPILNPAQDSVATRSTPSSAPAAWERSIWRGTPGSIARSR